MKTELTVSLKKFSAYILNNYQEAYFKKVRELTEHTSGNLLNYISELSEEDKQEFFRIPCLAYLIHLSLNKPEEHIEESMLQWKKDSSLTFPSANDLNIADTLKVLSLRKEALIRMMPFYTRDQKDTIYLILQLENYHRKIEQKALSFYNEKKKNQPQEKLFKDLAEKAPAVLFTFDIKSKRITYINKQIRKLLNKTEREVYHLTFDDIISVIHPEDRSSFKTAYKNILIKKNEEVEVNFRLKDSQEISGNYNCKLKIYKLDERGNPDQFIGLIQAKPSEDKSNSEKKSFYEGSILAKVGSYEIDLTKNTINASDEFYQLFQYTSNEVELNIKDFYKLIHREDKKYFKDILKNFIYHERKQYEFRTTLGDGTIIHIYGEGKIIKDFDGKITKVIGYVQDITDRKSNEQKLQQLNNQLEEIILERTSELRKSEEQFRFLAECSPQIVWTSDGEGKVDYVNEKWTIYSGLSMESIRMNGLLEVVHPEDIINLTSEWDNCLNTGKHFEMLIRLKRKEDKTYRWHITRAVPLKGINNQVIKWFGSSTDIHDYKLAEESIKLQAQILDSMAEGVCVTDQYGNILYTNPSEERIYGYPSGELIGKNFNLLNNYPDDQQLIIMEKIYGKIKENNFWIGELNSKRKNGSVFTTYSRISSLTINNNQYYVFVQEDVTESKLQHENQKLLEKVSIILSSSLDYKITIKRVANLIIPALDDWCVIDLINNKNKIQRVEVAHSNPLLKSLASQVKKYPPTLTMENHPLSQVVKSGQAFFEPVVSSTTLEMMAHDSDHAKVLATIKPKSIIAVPLKIRDKILGVLTLGITDSTKIYNQNDLKLTMELSRRVAYAIENALLYKNAEDALNNNRKSLSNLAIAKEELSRMNEELSFKNNELQKINNDLDNFIYTASHDLKAPISNLEGLLNILSEEMISEDGREILPMIHTSLIRLRNIIKELTEISKIQKNIDQDREIISLAELTQEVKISLEDEIRENNVSILVDFTEAPELFFSKKNLRSIIYNLVSNGVKYKSENPNSYVKIRSQKDMGGFLLTVEDNGLGIPKQHQEKIFNMFKRLHDHVEGTGIGLYIVKRIIENEGGKIEVESQEGKGSIFRIWLPDYKRESL